MVLCAQGSRAISEEVNVSEAAGHERIFGKALGLFEGDAQATERWLSSPRRALGGATPLERARTEDGAREVEALIGRLEHGVFS